MIGFINWLESHSPFDAFINWYDFHRGKWAEVVEASKASRWLAGFIEAARAAYDAGGGPHPQFQYGNQIYKGMGRIGSVIEQITKKVMPNHGHPREIPPPATVPRRPTQPGPGSTAEMPGLTDRNAPTTEMPATPVDPSRPFLSYLHSLDQRLRAIEGKMGMPEHPEYFTKT